MTRRARFIVIGTSAAAMLAAIAGYSYHQRLGLLAARGPRSELEAVKTPRAARGNLWVVAVGVSRYESGRGLRYAHADATAVEAAFKAQEGRPLYQHVDTKLLVNENATRSNIIGAIDRLVDEAKDDDVAVIFMAGHGVLEIASGGPSADRYYFLPYDASSKNLHDKGIRWSDFNDEINRLYRRVPRVVVMLDTCHAGALDLRGVSSQSQLARMLQLGRGVSLLAASAEDEDAMEKPEWKHGAFTHVLLRALSGDALRSPKDDIVWLTDLDHFLSRNLTNERQHFTPRIGADLPLVVVDRAAPRTDQADATERKAIVAAEPGAMPVAANAIEVINFENSRHDVDLEWLSSTLGAALNTSLYEANLEVYWDSFSRYQQPDFEAARYRGRGKIATGSYSVSEGTIRIDGRVVDTQTNETIEATAEQGPLPDALQLVSKIAVRLAQGLKAKLPSAQRESLVRQNDAQAKRMAQMLAGEGVTRHAPPTRETPEVGGSRGELQSELDPARDDPGRKASAGASMIAAAPTLLCGTAYGAEGPEGNRAEAFKTIEDYRSALEQKNLKRLASLYVSFSSDQREALEAYFEGVENLRVQITNILVEPRGQDLAVSYTRRDVFTDKETGKEAHLEVRLTRTLVREGGKWKIAGGA